MALPKNNKSTKPKQGLEHLIASLDEVLGDISSRSGSASAAKLRRARKQLEMAARRISDAAERLDAVKRPESIFDPSNPALVGRFIAIAMIAQDRAPLADLHRFYGAGGYAISYRGAFPAYRQISNTEHPIYVGKADPERSNAKTVVEQGTKLWGRLNEHSKTIGKATNLDVADFDC